MQQSVAYDLDVFAPRVPREDRPALHAAKGKKRHGLARINFTAVKVVILAALMISLICSVLFARINITEVTAEITQKQTELVALKSTYDYLNNKIETMTSLRNVEQYATATLGLEKLSQDQITYVERAPESSIVRSQSTTKKLVNNFSDLFSKLMEYLTA